MSTSPTPSEREKKDKEDRAREAEEQAKLPYKWTQTIQDLDITVSVPSNLRGKDIVVDMKKMYLKVGVKGQEPVIDVRLLPHLAIEGLSVSLPYILNWPTDVHFVYTGSPTPRNPPLRKHLDARNHHLRQRNLPPPRQNKQATVVGLRHHQQPLLPRHLKNHTREFEARGSGRGDERNGGENDV